VVHTHSVHATALACLERELPPFHYMVAVAGTDTIPCTPYHTFGSQALSTAVARALSDRNACLMAHHGLVTAGATLAQAMKIAIEIESLCEVYLKALAVAEPARLSARQMDEVLQKFKSYGRARRA
jgi:L-fuculose-phosphate aldolase